MMRFTKDQIIDALKKHFDIQHFEIKDETDKHRNHSESQKSGGGHFHVILVSPDFEGKTFLQRHRMVYDVLKDDFKSHIHALSLKTLTPQEFQSH